MIEASKHDVGLKSTSCMINESIAASVLCPISMSLQSYDLDRWSGVKTIVPLLQEPILAARRLYAVMGRYTGNL